MRSDRSRAAWNTVVAFAAMAIAIAIDVATGTMAVFLGLLSTGPLIAALQSTARQTAAVTAVAVISAIALGVPDGIFLEPDHLIRITVMMLVGLIAIRAARQREQRSTAARQLRQVAEVAQEVMLRQPPAVLSHVGLAAHYISASDVSTIGGDLYETAYTTTGVRLIIGDVRGKGLDAIRLAATVLAAFRQHMWGADLLLLAQRLDERVSRAASTEEFVTALIVEIGFDGTVAMVNCGHHAPVLLREGKLLDMEPAEASLPLGIGPTLRIDRFSMNVGDRLLMYTDGLVEARDANGEFFSLNRHADALGAPTVQAAVDALVERLLAHVPGRLSDDMAVLLVELLPSA